MTDTVTAEPLADENRALRYQVSNLREMLKTMRAELDQERAMAEGARRSLAYSTQRLHPGARGKDYAAF
jgi:hypothetical protein